MTFLKVTEVGGNPIVVNMAKVELFRSNGAGNTTLVFSDEGTITAKESFEQVENMLQVALTGYPGVVGVAEMMTVVR